MIVRSLGIIAMMVLTALVNPAPPAAAETATPRPGPHRAESLLDGQIMPVVALTPTIAARARCPQLANWAQQPSISPACSNRGFFAIVPGVALRTSSVVSSASDAGKQQQPMRERSVIIDGGGRLWPGSGRDLRRSMGNVGPAGENFIQFCTKFLGMVFVQERDGLVTVVAAPGRVLRAAQEVAAELVDMWSAGSVVVKDASRKSEVAGRLQKVMHGSKGVWLWMEGVADFDIPSEVNSTELEPISVEGLSTVVKLASALSGAGSPVEAICNASSQSWKFTTLSVGSHDQLIIEIVGPGYSPQCDRWIRQLVGRPLEDQNKSSYGSWAGSALRTALSRRQLVAEYVDAKIDWPGMGRWRHKYTSIRMPIQSDDGRPLMLAATRDIQVAPADAMP